MPTVCPSLIVLWSSDELDGFLSPQKGLLLPKAPLRGGTSCSSESLREAAWGALWGWRSRKQQSAGTRAIMVFCFKWSILEEMGDFAGLWGGNSSASFPQQVLYVNRLLAMENWVILISCKKFSDMETKNFWGRYLSLSKHNTYFPFFLQMQFLLQISVENNTIISS